MSRRAYLHPRLSSDQLRDRFRNCRDSKESRRWQLLWFVSLGHTIVEADYSQAELRVASHYGP